MQQDPVQLAKYFEGASFPATGGNLAGVAAGNGAPDEVIDKLRAFEGDHFADANKAVEALTKQR